MLARLSRVLAAEAALGDPAVPALLEHRFGGPGPNAPPLVFGRGAPGVTHRDISGAARDGSHPGLQGGAPAVDGRGAVAGVAGGANTGDGPGGATGAAGGEAPAEAVDEVRLRGRLDRVDVAEGRLLLVDYKDARTRTAYRELLSPGAFGVTSFQVPTYLLAAARALPGRSRLEATYLMLRSAERLEPVVLEAPGERHGAPDPSASAGVPGAEEPAAAAGEGDPRARPGGETGAQTPGGWAVNFERAVLAAVRRLRAGEVPVRPGDCGGCPHGALCRSQGWGGREA